MSSNLLGIPMTQSLKLGFKVGDYVEWISDADGPVQRGAIGCVGAGGV